MLRARRLVLALWLVVFAVSAVAASGLGSLLTNRFTLPNTDTARAEAILRAHFGQRSTGSFTIVVRAPGRAEALVPQARAAAARASRRLPTSRVVSVAPVSRDVVAASLVSELEPADAKGHTDAMRRAVGAIPGAQVFVTGQAAVEHDLDPVFQEDLRRGELFVAAPIALVLLVLTFGTLAFLIPFLFAALTIPTTLGIIWIFANVMELTTYLTNLVSLIGLGIAIDYSLLVVYRYREELAQGGTKEDAVVRTMETAGRAVVFSGTAVALGLALLVFMPLPFMRGFGIGGLIIPLVSVLAAVTILPVMLFWLGRPLDRVRIPFLGDRLVAGAEGTTGFWPRLAAAIMRRPVLFAAAASALLLAVATPVLDLELGPGSNEGIPKRLEAVRGLDVMTEAVGAGALAPTDVVVDTGVPGGADDPGVRRALAALRRGLAADPQVAAVRFDPSSPQSVDASRRYLHAQAIGRSEYGKPESLAFVDRLRERLVPAAAFPTATKVYAGGGPPGGTDFLHLTYSWFPWLVLAVLLATYVLLLRAFRSLLLPLKAIVLNLLSIGAAYGLLVVVFKWGWGEWAGLTPYDQIEGWIPVMLFAMLFGLSMDYEVFLVSRMREEWDAGASNETAVAQGLAKTGRLVTAAGLIMFAAFMGFVAGSVVGLQQFGFGLAAAILIDVTIVRALLVPSAMKLFGRWNWWLPEGVARVVRVEPSPLAHPVRATRIAAR
ncbi:MAG: MMPL family transporter [Pseudomonadota bacterium]